jgi:hypothetical protein
LRRVFRESSAAPAEGTVRVQDSRDESKRPSGVQNESGVDDQPSLVLSSVGGGIGCLCASVCNDLQITGRELKWGRGLLSAGFSDGLLVFESWVSQVRILSPRFGLTAIDCD